MTEGGPEVAWLVIEPGWKVVASDGAEVGAVESVVGDTGVDIFNGLSVSTGFFASPRYVPAEQVAGIEQGRVRLALTAAQVRRLGEFEQPPESLAIESDSVRGGEPPQRATPWARLTRRFRRR